MWEPLGLRRCSWSTRLYPAGPQGKRGRELRQVAEAEGFLSEAERVRGPELAMFMVEPGAQLYIKSVYFELFGFIVQSLGLSAEVYVIGGSPRAG